MDPNLVLRAARPHDAERAIDFAEAKRAEYARYSPIFWRPATDAREQHLPFLRLCIESDEFAGIVAEQGGEVVGFILANRKGAPVPFRADPEPTWFVDDFFVARADLWEGVGGALLGAVADAARAHGAMRVVVVTAQRDTPKRAFLLGAGYALAAAWWVHPLTPTTNAPLPLDAEIQAVVAPAPPVYNPGGPVALALTLGENPAAQVVRFDEWAAASGAVLAIVPARTNDQSLAETLQARGFAVASEWFVRAV